MTEDRDDNIFIAKVIGSSSKQISIPDEVCKFCDVEKEDLVKFKILQIKKGTKNEKS